MFFFKHKTADEWRISDWSSDVCSSDLKPGNRGVAQYPADRDLDLPALRHDDRADQHAARQRLGRPPARHPLPVDVPDPPRHLLFRLSDDRQRHPLVELPALLARLARDGMGDLPTRRLAPTAAAADRKSTRLNTSH